MKELEKILLVNAETNMTPWFNEITNELFSNWLINNGEGLFEFLEIEFVFKTKNDVHDDPFMAEADVQFLFGRWYLSNIGVSLTFGSDEFAASILIRSIRNIETGKSYLGPQRTFKILLEDAGSIINGKSGLVLQRRETKKEIKTYAIPRVYLPLEYSSQNMAGRLKFVFKPYRYVVQDIEDYPEKYLGILFLDRVMGEKVDVNGEGKIYTKYIQFYEKGLECNNLDLVWNVSSRMHRMAKLMGYLERQKQKKTTHLSKRANVW